MTNINCRLTAWTPRSPPALHGLVLSYLLVADTSQQLRSSQGCSLGLEVVSRRFLERLGLVSVLSQSWEFEKMERLSLISVLWLNILWTSLGQRTYSRVLCCGATLVSVTGGSLLPVLGCTTCCQLYSMQWTIICSFSRLLKRRWYNWYCGV